MAFGGHLETNHTISNITLSSSAAAAAAAAAALSFPNITIEIVLATIAAYYQRCHINVNNYHTIIVRAQS